MVPGMTERERRAVEMGRITWLSDAVLGPARMGRPLPTSPTPGSPRPRWHVELWRRGLALARMLGQRSRLLPLVPRKGLAGRVVALSR